MWLDTRAFGPVVRRTVDVVGTVGLTARGAVVALLGYLLLRASSTPTPRRRPVSTRCWGRSWTRPTADGSSPRSPSDSVCYGLYSWIEARYRRL